MGIVAGPRIAIPSFLNQYSYNFDGVNDYIDCGDVWDLSTYNWSPFTLSFWYKGANPIVGAVHSKSLFEFMTNQFIGVYDGYQGAANLKLYLQFQSSNIYWTVGSNGTVDLFDDQWHNVVIVFPSGSNDGVDATNAQMYIDNTLIAKSGSGVVSPPAAFYKWQTLKIMEGAWNPLQGKIDEVALWKTNQTANIESIYNGGVPKDLTDLSPMTWGRMGDNATWRDPQWLIPSNENKDKVSNYSMTFDGVNDYFRVYGPKIPIGLLSISFWMKTTDLVNGSVTSGMGNLGFIAVGAETRPILHFGSANYQYFADQRDKFDDEWHHWFVLTTGSAQGDIANSRLFVDGIEIAQGSGSIAGLVGSGGSGYIGRGQYGYLNCDIAEFAVWQSDQTSNIATISANPLNDLTSLSPQLYLKLGDTATYNGTSWDVPETIGGRVVTSLNMTLSDRVGDAPNSINNALSLNMVEVDRETDVPT